LRAANADLRVERRAVRRVRRGLRLSDCLAVVLARGPPVSRDLHHGQRGHGMPAVGPEL
jgi:hypothetical protein